MWLKKEDYAVHLRWHTMPQWFVKDWKVRNVEEGKQKLPFLMREREMKGEVLDLTRPNSFNEVRKMKPENEWRIPTWTPFPEVVEEPETCPIHQPLPPISKSERDEAIANRDAAWRVELRTKELKDLAMGIKPARVKGWKTYSDSELEASNMAYEVSTFLPLEALKRVEKVQELS